MRATKVEIRRVARVWYQSRISAKSESRSGPDLRSDTFAAGVTFVKLQQASHSPTRIRKCAELLCKIAKEVPVAMQKNEALGSGQKDPIFSHLCSNR